MTKRAIERTSTGVAGLDEILGGGLVRHGIYILSGRPGAGKTILSNQIAFAHVRAGGKVVYATLLAETHARLLAHLSVFSFFEEEPVGKDLRYLSAMDAVGGGGLDALLELVRGMVRDQGATLLVLDGMVTAEGLAKSKPEYKAFISELQAWVGVVGCTVLFVSSSDAAAPASPEHTMVDGIIELSTERFRMRDHRYIAVTKMRGTSFIEGQHGYLITDEGVTVYPRIEAVLQADRKSSVSRRLPTGVPGLDPVLSGGLCGESTTLLLGPSGSGKTVMGLQFLAEGARRGERCLYFGFYEPPANLIAKANRLGFDFSALIDGGQLSVEWFRPAEIQIDALVQLLMRTVRERKIERLVIDGFVGFRSTQFRERISSVFSAVSDELVSLGVTTLISDETRELFVRDVEVPTTDVSAIFHNIVFLRHVEQDAQLNRLLCVLKTRDSGADRRFWRYEIGERGLELVAPFDPGGGHLLAGGDG